MKKITILAAILFFFSITNGQITKGTFLIGGQVSSSNIDYKYNYTTVPTQEQTSKSANVSISIGKAFKDNSIYGISLGYSPFSNNYNYNTLNYYYYNEKSKTYNAGIYYRKYKKLLNVIYLFNEASVGFSYTHVNETDSVGATNPYISNTYSGNIAFSPGIAYRIYKRINLELSIPSLVRLSYSNTKSNDPYNDNTYTTVTKSNSFGLSTNLSLSSLAVGVKIIL